VGLNRSKYVGFDRSTPEQDWKGPYSHFVPLLIPVSLFYKLFK
jgi:hypothetical protein